MHPASSLVFATTKVHRFLSREDTLKLRPFVDVVWVIQRVPEDLKVNDGTSKEARTLMGDIMQVVMEKSFRWG